jgi:hypothetical protein
MAPGSEKTAPRPPTGFIGMTVDEARQSHFFQWFNLEAVTVPDTALRVFKPSGEKFHDLVTVNARVDAAGRIAMIELVVARSFIEDSREGMFAADIAKSFLEAALAPADRAHMQHLDTIAYLAAATPCRFSRRAPRTARRRRSLGTAHPIWSGSTRTRTGGVHSTRSSWRCRTS